MKPSLPLFCLKFVLSNNSVLMAEQALKKLDEQLQCSLCQETYKEPILLQCNHVYCRRCLVRLGKEQGSYSFTCPTCQTITSAKVTSELKSAFHINNLLEIRNYLTNINSSSSCSDECDGKNGRENESFSKQKNDTCYCSKHGKDMELICESCNVQICLQCTTKGSEHYSHNYGTPSGIMEMYKAKISALLEPVERRVQFIKEALDNVDERSNEISCQCDTLEATIENTVTKIHALVDARKADLINNLQKISNDKLSLLTSQKSSLETSHKQLRSCLEIVSEDLSHGMPLDIVKKKNAVTHLNKYVLSLETDLCEPMTKADIVFSEPMDAYDYAYKIYGSVYAFGSCDVSNSHASGSGLSCAVVGEEANITVHAVNYAGVPCTEPVKNLRCELLSNINGTKVRGTIKKIGKGGKTELRYLPTIQGRSSLHIAINNQPIPGSPFSVLVEYKFQKLISPILTMRGMMCPWGLAVSEQDDKVVVSDCSKKCISIYSRSLGVILRSFGNFKCPRGISLDKSSNMFVVDSGNHRIQKFTLEGDFLSSVGTLGTGPLEFYFPKDVAYNFVNNKIYVVDGNNHVQVLNSDLSLCGIFGKHGKGKGQFDNPWGIACDDNGHIYVADTYNHRVQVFTENKEFVTMFGLRGKEEGKLIDPIGIAVNSSKGVVYVSERQNDRVSIFSVSGRFVASSTGEGHKCGLSVDKDGLVYVCNMSKGHIQVF